MSELRWARDPRTMYARQGRVLIGAVAVLLLASAWAATAASASGSSGVAQSPVSTPGGPTSLGESGAAGWSVGALLAAPTAAVAMNGPGLGVAGAVRLGAEPASAELNVLFTLHYAHPAALAALLQGLSDPASPEYHEYLTAAQFDAEFGQPASVYQEFLGYLGAFGLSSVVAYPDHVEIGFTATPGQVEQVLHTSIARFSMEGTTFFAPASSPRLPAPLAPYVLSVDGLSNFSNPMITTDLVGGGLGPHASTAVAPLDGNDPCQVFTCTTIDGYAYPEPIPNYANTEFTGEAIPGSDLQVAYNVTPLFGSVGFQGPSTGEENIATLLWTSPVDNATYMGPFCDNQSSSEYAWDFYAPDVSNYLNLTLPTGEPQPQVVSVPQAGYAYDDPAGSEGLSASCIGPIGDGSDFENTLDVDMAGSLAPGASVYQVFGGTSSLLGTVDTDFADVLSPSPAAISATGGSDTSATVRGLQNVSVISNSWAEVEVPYGGGLPYCDELNDSTWFSLLEQAQARGITVLAGSGDFAIGRPCTPAAQAYDTFGDVAVGGTTLTLVPTTLERANTSTTDEYTVCHAAGGECAGEVPWTFPCAGGQCGGTTGGISLSFPETDWEAGSSDVNGVIAGAGSGSDRASPDIAAMANNTEIQITWDNVTQTVASYATPGSDDRVIAGTSVATPVEAGVVSEIDFALAQEHQPRLGFLDPQAYQWGQDQYAGALSTPPFLDVVHGSVHEDSAHLRPAVVGYDLSTGWGPLNAASYVDLEASLPVVTFSATGLPAGSPWWVSMDGNTVSSNTSTVEFSEFNGTYNYTLGAHCYAGSPSSGEVTVAGANLTEEISFDAAACLTVTPSTASVGTTLAFAGTDFAPNAEVSVTWAGGTSCSTTTSGSGGFSCDYRLPATAAGDYAFTAADSLEDASTVSVVVLPTLSLSPTEGDWGTSITFTGAGFAENSSVSVNTTSGVGLCSTETGAVGSFSCTADLPTGTPCGPATFVATDAGSNTASATFRVLSCVRFTETGLPTGAPWTVTLDGTPQTAHVATILFTEANGEYGYSVSSTTEYGASPSSGTITVSNGPVNVSVAFTPPTFSVTFKETGLPSGLEWSVSFNGGGYQESTTTTDVFTASNGTYPFSIPDSHYSGDVYYEPTPASGHVTVNGANLQESVSFKETVICPRCLLPAPTVAPTEPAGTALPMALPLGTATAGTLAALPRPVMLMRAP